MNFDAVKAILKPMSDEQFEASLRRQSGEHQHEQAVGLDDVGLGQLARIVVAERDAAPRDL